MIELKVETCYFRPKPVNREGRNDATTTEIYALYLNENKKKSACVACKRDDLIVSHPIFHKLDMNDAMGSQ